MNIDLRKDCPMRHENGNCTVAGGFCTAVSDPICEALHNAYNSGYFDGAVDIFKWHSKRFDLRPPCGIPYTDGTGKITQRKIMGKD